MVSASAIGTLGVLLGATLVALGFSDAGLGILLLGVVGYAVVGIASSTENEPPRGRQ